MDYFCPRLTLVRDRVRNEVLDDADDDELVVLAHRRHVGIERQCLGAFYGGVTSRVFEFSRVEESAYV